jgi:hypothetical protein
MDVQFTIEYCSEGSPTDLWGTFNGMRWDFWAKYGVWEFRLSESEAILPELMGPSDSGLCINGNYGEGSETHRRMNREEAEQIVQTCLTQYQIERPS